MKINTVRYLGIFLLGATISISCNSNTAPKGDIESDIENPATSQDSVTSYKQSGATGDSANLKSVDARRLSDGKDSVQGEVTPPSAQKQ